MQTRINTALKEGLTVSDAVRILLTVAKDAALPFPLATDPAGHEAWFRAKVQQALQVPVRPFRMMTWRPISPSGTQPHFTSAENDP